VTVTRIKSMPTGLDILASTMADFVMEQPSLAKDILQEARLAIRFHDEQAGKKSANVRKCSIAAAKEVLSSGRPILSKLLDKAFFFVGDSINNKIIEEDLYPKMRKSHTRKMEWDKADMNTINVTWKDLALIRRNQIPPRIKKFIQAGE
jgi:hypothetical protein